MNFAPKDEAQERVLEVELARSEALVDDALRGYGPPIAEKPQQRPKITRAERACRYCGSWWRDEDHRCSECGALGDGSRETLEPLAQAPFRIFTG